VTSSGQLRRVFAADLVCACGWAGETDWEYDPEVDRECAYADCPDCDAEVMASMSEGDF
jgi:hypothetical protein